MVVPALRFTLLTLALWSYAPAAQAQESESSAAAAARSADEEAEIAKELGEIQDSTQAQQASLPASPTPKSPASSAGPSNAFNPALSGTVSMFAGGTSRAADAEEEEGHAGPGHLSSGLMLQEVELRFSAIIDPYLRADITLSGHLDEIAFEEAYLTTLSLPSITVRAGKMIANVGRHNLLHTHAYPFITAPLPWRVLLGPEGLRDTGVSADILLPLPFYTELNIQAFAGDWPMMEAERGDDPTTAVDEFRPDQRRDEDLAYVGHLKTVHEFGLSTTLELGGSYVGGNNGHGELSHTVGGDLTVKWRPVDAERYTSLEWAAEYLWVQKNGASGDKEVGGVYTSLRYQFAQRYWLQGRAALLGVPAGAEGPIWRGEILFAVVPSEFSTVRLQYAVEGPVDGSSSPIHELFLQAVVSIGSHPAHAY